MSSSDPTLYSTILDVVNGGYNTFLGYANQSFDLAVQASQALREAEFTFTPISISFEGDFAGGSFVAPERPEGTISSYRRPDSLPSFAPENLPVAVTTPPPADPGVDLVNYAPPGGMPGDFDVAHPGAAPNPGVVVVPDDDSDYTLPAQPTLLDLGVVTPPTINEVEFEGVRPGDGPAVPVVPFSWTEQAYSSTLADAIKASLLSIITADTPNSGLPAGVEQQLFDRARARTLRDAVRSRQAIAAEFGERGFEEPSGLQSKRALQVEQGVQDKVNETNREITIQVHEKRLEMFRFAITSGLGYEQTFISMHMQMEQRRFEAARFLFESVLQIFNARIALFNAQVQAYQTDAQVFRDRVQAELVKAEIYRAQIEAQKTIGELNRTLVEMYVAQIGAIRQQAEIYRTRVEAARVRIEANALLIEGYRAEVQAFGESVRAYSAQWEGYSARVRAELGKVEAADVMARIYATRTTAWATQQQSEQERVRTYLARDAQRVAVFQAQVGGFAAEVQAEASRMNAEAQAVGANASVYAAAGQIAIAESNKLDRVAEVAIQKGNAEAQIRLENARANLQAALQSSGYYLQSLQTLSQASTQLAGSSMSAVNVSGGVSGSVGQSYGFSNSQSLSKSWGWQGEVETVSPPTY